MRSPHPRAGYSPARRVAMIVFGVIWFCFGALLLFAVLEHDERYPGPLTRDEKNIRAAIGLVTLCGLRLVYTGLTPRKREDEFDDPEYPDVYTP
jgi:hypothetical protein